MDNKVFVKCKGEHTKFQPKSNELSCPSCGASYEYFRVDCSDGESVWGCNRIHKEDYMLCDSCGYVGLGSQVAERLENITKVKNMKPFWNGQTCPACEKGKIHANIEDVEYEYRNNKITFNDVVIYRCDLCNEGFPNEKHQYITQYLLGEYRKLIDIMFGKDK